ncbi:Aspartate kinase (modular protein) [Candidatus Xenohaliotis californiensis]|uniref:aspartate kinase n=1 Tax=Candidatus Xenohaliotis californiensis TaxID=84677 RepID=A0ABM9N862_9RICK|nr:Aspartate kinase (modular protein) [Candidatus Xenohaliotis californiensis]
MITKVKKFGGTSLYNETSLQNAAMVITEDIQNGFNVVVVVSAASGQTNSLLEHIANIGCEISLCEEDVVLATGEQINAALLAITLIKIGVKARSFMGWQLPIITNELHRDADIIDINVKQLKDCIAAGVVPIVAGFQGISYSYNITTLGRGGSDITATKLASILNAYKCEIYTDVDGIYAANPKIVLGAHKFTQLNYTLMNKAALLGAKVIHHKAVNDAMKHNLTIEILPSFEETDGTLLTANSSGGEIMLCSRCNIYACITNNSELLTGLHQNIYIANSVTTPKIMFVYMQKPSATIFNKMKLSGKVVCMTEVSVVSLDMIFSLQNILNLLMQSGIRVFATRECGNSKIFLVKPADEYSAIRVLYKHFYHIQYVNTLSEL